MTHTASEPNCSLDGRRVAMKTSVDCFSVYSRQMTSKATETTSHLQPLWNPPDFHLKYGNMSLKWRPTVQVLRLLHYTPSITTTIDKTLNRGGFVALL